MKVIKCNVTNKDTIASRQRKETRRKKKKKKQVVFVIGNIWEEFKAFVCFGPIKNILIPTFPNLKFLFHLG